jgi:hypothetical protein
MGIRSYADGSRTRYRLRRVGTGAVYVKTDEDPRQERLRARPNASHLSARWQNNLCGSTSDVSWLRTGRCNAPRANAEEVGVAVGTALCRSSWRCLQSGSVHLNDGGITFKLQTRARRFNGRIMISVTRRDPAFAPEKTDNTLRAGLGRSLKSEEHGSGP